MYYWESDQEDFLVLSGECLLIVEGEERRLRGEWDFFHCALNTTHAFVGAGDCPSVILMVGARTTGQHDPLPATRSRSSTAPASSRTRPRRRRRTRASALATRSSRPLGRAALEPLSASGTQRTADHRE